MAQREQKDIEPYSVNTAVNMPESTIWNTNQKLQDNVRNTARTTRKKLMSAVNNIADSTKTKSLSDPSNIMPNIKMKFSHIKRYMAKHTENKSIRRERNGVKTTEHDHMNMLKSIDKRKKAVSPQHSEIIADAPES